MHIQNHLLSNSDKSDYGEYLFTKLSDSLNIGKRSLYLAVQFYKTYNNISSLSNNLTWSHFRVLLTIKTEEKRKQYKKILLEKN